MFNILYQLLKITLAALVIIFTIAIITHSEEVKKSPNDEVQLLPLTSEDMQRYLASATGEKLIFNRKTSGDGCVGVVYMVKKISDDVLDIQSYSPTYDLVCAQQVLRVDLKKMATTNP